MVNKELLEENLDNVNWDEMFNVKDSDGKRNWKLAQVVVGTVVQIRHHLSLLPDSIKLTVMKSLVMGHVDYANLLRTDLFD